MHGANKLELEGLKKMTLMTRIIKIILRQHKKLKKKTFKKMLLVMNKLNWEVKSNILLKFTPLLPIFYCSISALGVDFKEEKYGCKITWTKYGEKPSFVIVFCSFSDGASVGAKCHPDGHLSAE